MSNRGNKPVGTTMRVLMLLSLLVIGIGVFVAIKASRGRQAFPERGAASLPGQAGMAGAQPGDRPAAR